ncbi:hypothetical protein Y032_0004g2243 [Ancylostoma ceylanicum]|uniref:C2H2-type domain-containing protein n=1 Tax=Ancylostoma ceylanicum TaxID=53326 RepID=A0A016VWC7_9BILA|nr:hypothetical protein Y032_0004g2243 [Ancylostoma ceylanicum]
MHIRLSFRNKLLSPTQRLHSAELPCPDCGSILRTPAALRKHALVHAERKFVCNQCGKGFAERTKLNRHMLTHTGEKAFKVQARPMFKKQVLAEKYGEGSANVIVISDVVWIEL